MKVIRDGVAFGIGENGIGIRSMLSIKGLDNGDSPMLLQFVRWAGKGGRAQDEGLGGWFKEFGLGFSLSSRRVY
jgi:hypothetical protein